MTLTLKLALQLLSMACFIVVIAASRVWYGPSSQYGWAGSGLLACGLLLWEASEVFTA